MLLVVTVLLEYIDLVLSFVWQCIFGGIGCALHVHPEYSSQYNSNLNCLLYSLSGHLFRKTTSLKDQH